MEMRWRKIKEGLMAKKNKHKKIQNTIKINKTEGPIVGYRDAGKLIEYFVFPETIQNGWQDSPDKCKNNFIPDKLIPAK